MSNIANIDKYIHTNNTQKQSNIYSDNLSKIFISTSCTDSTLCRAVGNGEEK